MVTNTSCFDFNNTQVKRAYDLIANTNVSFFLTGKAGTGKTTFLRNIQKEVDKQFAVVAPTGIAAILAGGVTIHSFFGFPTHALAPNTLGSAIRFQFDTLRRVDTIIVDEVSMVRCDLIDAIDYNLRQVMRNNLPFGGKQIVFVGDLFQLPPILKRGGDEEALIRDVYNTTSPFFFKANVFRRMNMPCIEFGKVYRQDNQLFLNVLNNIRVGKVSQTDLDVLNSRVCNPNASDGIVITLASLNAKAKDINDSQLAKLDTDLVTYKASVKGDMQKQEPVPSMLGLKVGAQVMFARNDQNGRWANGTLGIVSKLDKDGVFVTIGDVEHQVEPVTWDSVSYSYNPKTKKLDKTVVGSFTQYPLRLAWAITIHKSQGMTFDKMVLDLSGRLFSKNQLYVALSRVKSLDGLFLTSPVMAHHIGTSEEVLSYSSHYNDNGVIDKAIESGSRIYPLLKQGDFDGLAISCLEQAFANTANGNYRDASMDLCQMLGFVIDDTCLLGKAKNVQLVCGDNIIAHFINAVFCLYAGDYNNALGYCDKVLLKRPECKEMLYVKARSLSMIGRFKQADGIHSELASLLDGQFDSKVYLRAGMLNELEIGDPGFDLVRMVVNYNPKYLPAIASLRMLMQRKSIILKSCSEPNTLVDAFNSDMSAADLSALLKSAMQSDKEHYAGLLKSIKKQEF